MRVHKALVLLAAAAAPIAAMADNLNLSSGTAAYSVTEPSSTTITALDSTANPGWTLTIPGATWINTTGSGTTNVANGLYVYTTTFTLSSASNLSGSYTSDNGAMVFLSGGSISTPDELASSTYVESFNVITPFSAGGLGPGTYTLTFDVENGSGLNTPPGTDGNSDNGPNGLLVGASTVTATPEPSSLALLGTGILSAAGIARRKLFSR
jgi:hypothetical protein